MKSITTATLKQITENILLRTALREVFLIFFKKYKSLESDENIRIWLYRTADNVIRNYNRKFAVSDISISDVEEELRDFSEVSSFEEKRKYSRQPFR